METLELNNDNYMGYCTINKGETIIIVEYSILDNSQDDNQWTRIWNKGIRQLLRKTKAKSVIVADNANVWGT